MPAARVLPAHPSSAAAARRFARDVLHEWHEDDAAEIVELLISELVTNAVLHAGSPVELELRRRADRLRVEIADGSPVLPTVRDYGVEAVTGRGLGMVELLTVDWGITRRPGNGKVVWFEVPAAHTGSDEMPAQDGSDARRDEDEDEVVVQLVGIPVQLFRAMQQHTDALLREHSLLAMHEGPTAQVHLDIDQTAVPAMLQSALEAGSSTADLVLAAPPAAAATIPRVQQALATADALAAEGQLLTTPALPEVVELRDWFVAEVLRQLEGAAPGRWQGGTTQRTRAVREVDAAAALQNLATAAVVADDENAIVYANAAAELLLGWSAGGLAGQRLTAIIPDRLHEAHVAGYTRYLVTGEARLLGHPVRVPAKRRDGTEVPIELVLSGYAVDGRRMFVGSLLPVSNAASSRESLHAWLQAVDAVLALAGEHRPLRSVAVEVLEAAGNTLPWDTAALWLPEGDALRCAHVWEREPGRFDTFVRTTWQRQFARGEGLPGAVWATASARALPDLVAESNFPRAAVAIDAGLRSGCGLPIASGGEVHGVIELFATAVSAVDDDLLDVVMSFGAAVGLIPT